MAPLEISDAFNMYFPITVIYDPGSFYGHHEYDLGIAGMFGFSSDFLDAYHEIIPKVCSIFNMTINLNMTLILNMTLALKMNLKLKYDSQSKDEPICQHDPNT